MIDDRLDESSRKFIGLCLWQFMGTKVVLILGILPLPSDLLANAFQYNFTGDTLCRYYIADYMRVCLIYLVMMTMLWDSAFFFFLYRLKPASDPITYLGYVLANTTTYVLFAAIIGCDSLRLACGLDRGAESVLALFIGAAGLISLVTEVSCLKKFIVETCRLHVIIDTLPLLEEGGGGGDDDDTPPDIRCK